MSARVELVYYASPTMLAYEQEVATDRDDNSVLEGVAGCRLYTNGTGSLSAVPSIDTILAAVATSERPAAHQDAHG